MKNVEGSWIRKLIMTSLLTGAGSTAAFAQDAAQAPAAAPPSTLTAGEVADIVVSYWAKELAGWL